MPKKVSTPLPLTCTLQEAIRFIDDSDGKEFHIDFIKRSDGTLRHTLCKTGVKSRKHGERAYDFKEKQVYCVYDLAEDDYRMIPYEGITRIKMNDVWYDVIQPKE